MNNNMLCSQLHVLNIIHNKLFLFSRQTHVLYARYLIHFNPYSPNFGNESMIIMMNQKHVTDQDEHFRSHH